MSVDKPINSEYPETSVVITIRSSRIPLLGKRANESRVGLIYISLVENGVVMDNF